MNRFWGGGANIEASQPLRKRRGEVRIFKGREKRRGIIWDQYSTAFPNRIGISNRAAKRPLRDPSRIVEGSNVSL